MAGRTAVVIGVFPAGGAAGGGLLEDTHQRRVIRLRTEELVYIADRLQMHGTHAGPDSFEFPLPFVYQVRWAEDDGTLGVAAGGNGRSQAGLPRAHFADADSFRIRFQARQDGCGRMFLSWQQAGLAVHPWNRSLLAQAAQQTAVSIQIELVHRRIILGHDTGQVGNPFLQELFQFYAFVAGDLASGIHGGDVGDDCFRLHVRHPGTAVGQRFFIFFGMSHFVVAPFD